MGTLLKNGLSEGDLADIRRLEKICANDEVRDMKLNWEMLQNRPAAEINDLLYYEDSQLVGFWGLYLIDPKHKEIEITGMVHPGYRRRGIGRQLIARALELCTARDASRVLLITERSSVSGTEFAKAAGFCYAVSEYRMRFTEADSPELSANTQVVGISARSAIPSDDGIIALIDSLCFETSGEVVRESALDEATGKVEPANFKYGQDATYVAELNGRVIGKICGIVENNEGYIFGFGILPEFRSRGYGRTILRWMVAKLLEADVSTILLEVATENEKALHLYESCGFRRVAVYDYYEFFTRNGK